MAANTSSISITFSPGASTSVTPSSTITAAGCTRLTSQINIVPAANIDSQSYAVGLPALADGAKVYVINQDGSQALTIFPPSNGKIDNGATDSQTTLAAGKAAMFLYAPNTLDSNGATLYNTWKLPGA